MDLRFHTKPWQHQLDALKFALERPATMLAMDMGTGKSKVVVDLVVNTPVTRILILCPLAVVPVWPKQFAMHCIPEESIIISAPLAGSVVKKAETLMRDYEMAEFERKKFVFVTNYESAREEAMQKVIFFIKWDVVALDESHKIKDPSGITSRMCSHLGAIAERRLCLTGTPMPHSPLDIFAQYRFLDTRIFGNSFYLFKAAHTVLGGWMNKQILRFRNMDTLNRKFYSIAFRVKKDDVLDLPDTIDQEQFCYLDGQTLQCYNRMERDFIVELEDEVITASNALVKLLKLQQITSGFVGDGGLNLEIGNEKMRLFSDVLANIEKDEPVVVFCRFHMDIEKIKAHCSKETITCSELSGRINQLSDWQGGRTRILIAQIQSGGVGIDLTRARYSIYYSIGFSLGDYLQSRARIHRPGQTKHVVYIHLVAKDTVDEICLYALQKRWNVIESILSEFKMKGGDRSGLRKAQAVR